MACNTVRVSSVCARRKPPPPKPRSFRMPTKLITTSWPRKRSLSCGSSYTSQFSRVRPGSTSRCLCCSRSRDSTVTACPSLIRRATRRVPRNPVPPRMQIDNGLMRSPNGNQYYRAAALHVEHQETSAFCDIAKVLQGRDRGAADCADEVVGAQPRLRRGTAVLHGAHEHAGRLRRIGEIRALEPAMHIRGGDSLALRVLRDQRRN